MHMVIGLPASHHCVVGIEWIIRGIPAQSAPYEGSVWAVFSLPYFFNLTKAEAPNAGSLGSIPGQGPKSHMPQRSNILRVPTKIQHSQINK